MCIRQRYRYDPVHARYKLPCLKAFIGNLAERWSGMNQDMLEKMMQKMDETFRDIDNMFSDLDQQFGDQLGDRFGRFPVDVEETEENIVVKADLPGVEKDQIDVTATGDQVRIEATDEQEVREEGKNYLRQERRAKNHQRRIRLPVEVDPDSAEATYTNGVLTITLSKTEDSQGEDIEIT